MLWLVIASRLASNSRCLYVTHVSFSFLLRKRTAESRTFATLAALSRITFSHGRKASGFIASNLPKSGFEPKVVGENTCRPAPPVLHPSLLRLQSASSPRPCSDSLIPSPPSPSAHDAQPTMAPRKEKAEKASSDQGRLTLRTQGHV